MPHNQDTPSQKLTEGLTSIALTALVLVSVKDPTQAALATAAVSPLAEAFAQLFHSRIKRRSEAFVRGVVLSAEVSDQEALRELDEKLKEPGVQDALLESLRAMVDAVDDAVVPSLGALLRLYAVEGKKPDALFRNVTNLLRDMDEAEFKSLRSIVVAFWTIPTGITGDVRYTAKYLSYNPLTPSDRVAIGTDRNNVFSEGPFVPIGLTERAVLAKLERHLQELSPTIPYSGHELQLSGQQLILLRKILDLPTT